MTTAIGGPRRVYDDKEREIIDGFRERYMACTTPGERRDLATKKLFPELFNYWSSLGVNLNQEEENRRSDVSKKYL